MPDYLEKGVGVQGVQGVQGIQGVQGERGEAGVDSNETELVLAPQHLVNASWKMVSLSLLAVVISLTLILVYVFIGVDAMNKSADTMDESVAKIQASNDELAADMHVLADDLSADHVRLVCRDAASFAETRATADAIVVFLNELSKLGTDQPVDRTAIAAVIQNLRNVQGQRDTTISTCINGSASQAEELPSQSNG